MSLAGRMKTRSWLKVGYGRAKQLEEDLAWLGHLGDLGDISRPEGPGLCWTLCGQGWVVG